MVNFCTNYNIHERNLVTQWHKLWVGKLRGSTFVCPNFGSDYIAGILILPKEFPIENSGPIPERLLLHVAPGVVWNGKYSVERNWIEGLEKMMLYYCIKPYYLIAMEYIGGPSFNLQIYNPYGVEVNYTVTDKSETLSSMDRSFFNFSDIEVDKLCGTMFSNVYNSGLHVYNLLISSSHLLKKDHTKILNRYACKQLGLLEEMKSVTLFFKNMSWVVNLKWDNGKAYMDRTWYDFARASRVKEGDICAFMLSGPPGKFRVCVYERDLLTKCNEKGIGHASKVTNWFKIVNDVVLYAGQMEIPRVFMEMNGGVLEETVNLIMGDGCSVAVNFSRSQSFFHGLKTLVDTYSIQLNDVMVFHFLSDSTFAVSLFKATGMEYKLNSSHGAATKKTGGIREEEVIILSDSSGDGEPDLAMDIDGGIADAQNLELADDGNNEGNEFGDGNPLNMSFRVTLKKSHVDKRDHGARNICRFGKG
ncbi:hypothetical protein DCAR_0101401 [Daucus carota subsp. sativus]|uniref:TF-B3 domain-containing protein n=1 Tax=Daucus carota subsp. sativus TaxID=79200 RepID=A0AAF0W4K3_DAUCS|nr:hypothetical protein DCAR_0101401 [Daucus carota subsp. sativus]